MATELAKIFVDEVSGVDAPANQTPGWLMTKAASGAVAAAVADAEAADLTVSKDEVGAVRGFLARLRKHNDTEEITMTKDELLEILDARDAKLAKSAADEEAAAVARAEEIKAEAERLAAEKLEADKAAEAEAVAEAERVAAEAAAAEGTTPEGEATESTEPTLVTAEEFAALSDRVEALVKAITGEDGDGGLAGAVNAMLKRSAVSAQVAEAPAEETITKNAGSGEPLLAMRAALRETWNRGNGASTTIGDGRIS